MLLPIMRSSSPKVKHFPQHVLWAPGLHVAVPAVVERAMQVPCFTGRVRPSRSVPTWRPERQGSSGGQNHRIGQSPFSHSHFSLVHMELIFQKLYMLMT